MTEKQASSEIAQSRERFLDEISKQMGDAGYCNYAACRTFLARAMDEGTLEVNRTCTDGTHNANSALYEEANELRKRLELGDGEPSPDIDKLWIRWSQFRACSLGEIRVAKDFARYVSARSGAAQEVSPPSREELLKEIINDPANQIFGISLSEAYRRVRAEGDTRELKAALAGLLACTEMRGDAAKMLAVCKAKKALKNAGWGVSKGGVKMPYPEGMSVDVSFSPTMQRFHVTALLRNGEYELFTASRHLSDALENLAEQIRIKYEDSQHATGSAL